MTGNGLLVGGQIKAVVPDGAGGWHVGGTFTNIGPFAITNIAHILPSLGLDVGWNPLVIGSTVNALILDSGVLYAGGSFTRIQGQANSGGLFGLSTTNGSVVWNPTLSGTVNALALTNGLIYAGGNFFSVGNSNNQDLAAISIATTFATGWNPAPDAAVLALQVSGTNIYVGGSFANIGSKARNRLAALSLSSGVATTWNPNPNGIVRALLVTSTNAYVGGDFTTISVQNRHSFAALGLTGTGAAESLDLQLQTGTTVNIVRSLLLQSNLLYVGGQFTNSLGAQAAAIAGVNITTGTPAPTPLGSDFNGASGNPFGVNAMASANGQVLAVGDFQSLGGVARHEAAALSLATGAALPWAPNFSGPVSAFACGTNRIYVGGAFSNVNGTTSAQGLAAVDPVSGNPLSFNFQGTNSFSPVLIESLITSTNGLYVGGSFTTVSGQPRRLLALVDSVTGALIPGFNGNLGGGNVGVDTMALDSTNLYVGGDFSSVNGVSQPRLAALSALDGTPQSWQPLPNQTVTTLAAAGGVLYVGGNFSIIEGITLRNFAAFNLADDSLDPIDATLPTSASGITALGASATSIYIGGSFTAAGGEFRNNLACLSAVDASAEQWNPSTDVGPTVFTVTDQSVFVGGPFRYFGVQPAGFFAAFSRAPQFLSSSMADPVTAQFTTTTGDRTDVVIQSSPDLKNGGTWTSIATNSPAFYWTFQVPATDPKAFFRAVSR